MFSFHIRESVAFSHSAHRETILKCLPHSVDAEGVNRGHVTDSVHSGGQKLSTPFFLLSDILPSKKMLQS